MKIKVYKKRHQAILMTCDNLLLTELVSRVLYALRRSNHLSSLAIADKFKPFGSATMKRHDQLVKTNLENQGVASDRVYSGSMLP